MGCRNKISSVAFVVVVLLLSVYSYQVVSAAVIFGVSPGNVNLQGVLRGGYAERPITITLDVEDPVMINLEPWGDIESWINVTQNTSVSRVDPGRLIVGILPPSDIPNGNYTGYLRVETSSLPGTTVEGGNAASVVRSVVDVAFTIGITDIEFFSCTAGGYSVSAVEQGDDLVFEVDIRNNGNIRFRPEFEATIWDQEQVVIVDEIQLRGSEILPTQTVRTQFRVSTENYETEQYWVDVRVPDCYSENVLTFDVLEPGALKAEGVIRGMRSAVWTEVGDTIPIQVLFENIGEKTIESYFEGQIERDGKIVQLLQSASQDVAVDESTNFTFFFTPQREGQYLASGRVFYDQKRTFPSSTVINVTSSGFSYRPIITFLMYLLIITFIAFILYKIRSEKRRYKQRFRH